jgi:hypothetical protein
MFETRQAVEHDVERIILDERRPTYLMPFKHAQAVKFEVF